MGAIGTQSEHKSAKTKTNTNTKTKAEKMSTRVVVIGGGLAGLSAAHTIIENGGRVTLVDKMAFLGGNSTKATSGISGTLTKAQVTQDIHDSPMVFEKDILKAACGLTHDSPPEHTIPLAHVLAYGSGPAVDWLMERFELDLSKLALMGGHSFPRTHRGKEKFPGFTITYTLMEALEEIEEKTKGEKARIITKAQAKELLKDSAGKVVGIEYELRNGKKEKLFGPVIIATSGFGADFDPDSILVKVRPDIQHLSTTNGEHCTGDGIKMAQKVSGATVDIDRVQVHPTGLVHPKEPNAKVKFLAAEALRGVGGILIDAKGNRFCNELGTRDYVTDCMNKGHGPFRLILNSKASKEIEWHCKHYKGRGVMKPFSSGSELCQEMGISASKLSDTFNKYNADAGKGHPDGYGKKFFPNVPYNVNDSFNVAIVTPVIHYCMGGLKIDTDAWCRPRPEPTSLDFMLLARWPVAFMEETGLEETPCSTASSSEELPVQPLRETFLPLLSTRWRRAEACKARLSPLRATPWPEPWKESPDRLFFPRSKLRSTTRLTTAGSSWGAKFTMLPTSLMITQVERRLS